MGNAKSDPLQNDAPSPSPPAPRNAPPTPCLAPVYLPGPQPASLSPILLAATPITAPSKDVKSPAATSLARVSLAAFGGMLVGLSRNPSSRMGAPSVASVARRLAGRSPLLAWSAATGTFAGIVEGTILLSPTENVVRMVQLSEGSSGGVVIVRDFCTLVDYVLGGAAAGGIFSEASTLTGIFSDSSGRRQRFGKSTRTCMVKETFVPVRRLGTLSGLAIGGSMGLFAGVAVVGLNALAQLAEGSNNNQQK
mmetsp:Transcript_8484/g.18672  ORF Transcript_8484/g.18672 Transcript_8484/m.18672 type:complete len:251 (-) Transcript_8484:54-806(-)